MTKRDALALLLLKTFSRQLASDELCAKVRETCSHADALIERNKAYAGRSEIDLLKLSFDALVKYEQMLDAQCAVAKLRLLNAPEAEFEAAVERATNALMEVYT